MKAFIAFEIVEIFRHNEDILKDAVWIFSSMLQMVFYIYYMI